MKTALTVLCLFAASCDAGPGPGPVVGGGGTSGVAGSGGGGAGGGAASNDITSYWAVSLNGGQPPSCAGQMVQTWHQDASASPISVSGSWTCVESAADCTYVVAYLDANHVCISYSGQVTGEIVSGGGTTLTLYTDPSHAVTMTGTTTPAAIVGSAHFSDVSVPFTATGQAN